MRVPERLRPWLAWRRLVRLALVAAGAVLLLVGGCVAWVRGSTAGHLYYRAGDTPVAPVALVMGTEVEINGYPSPFLYGRLEMARQLYLRHRVRAVLVSGDHGRWAYDEPDTMREWLMEHGVPAGKVVTDYAGFTTWQSCVRAKQVFGVHRAIVVSQDFHLPRAVALCRAEGIDADGAGDTTETHDNIYWQDVAREQPAAVEAAWQAVVRPTPRFLGHREHGVDDAVR